MTTVRVPFVATFVPKNCEIGAPEIVGELGVATLETDNPNTVEAIKAWLPETATSIAPPTPGVNPISVGSALATSSLVIVTVALLVEPTVYAALSLKVTTTVSSLSTAVSLTGVTVFTADADPAGIVTLVPMLV
jgi:hypothetical protein